MKRNLILIIPALILLLGTYFFYEPLLEAFDNKEVLTSFIVIVGLLVIFLNGLFIFISYRQSEKVEKLNNRLQMWTRLSYHVNQVGDEVFNELPIGILAYDDELELKWVNKYSNQIFDKDLIDEEVLEVNEELYELITEEREKGTIKIGNKFFDVVNKVELGFIYLFDQTEREILKNKYNDQIPAMGIMYLDNLDESISNLDVSVQSSIRGEYLSAIDDWVTTHKGYLKPYGDDRLVFLTHYNNLETMMDNKFIILETIRDISKNYEVRVSLSIGIAAWDLPYIDLGIYAQNAIDLAEKRGGDQVVVNIQNKKIEYFGAKLDSSSKSSRVGARVNSQTIRDYIKKASNIFIMGHNQMDLDAFGSMIAMYHLSKIDIPEVYKIIDFDKLDSTVRKVYPEAILEDENFNDDVLTSLEAIELIDEGSLLIIVDTQSEGLVMSKELLDAVDNKIVIDHHRIRDEGFDAMFSYVESSASSAIELIIELFTFYEDDKLRFTPIEASIMYGGLVLDTNNFTIRTSVRTFEVAYKLIEVGADPILVKMWLRKDLNRTLTINKLVATTEVFMNKFAFLISKEPIEDRILLAQASDQALLIDGLEAAFTIAKVGDVIAVSARSMASINVQLIMEYIGGGGHLTSAAAQVKNKTIDEVYNEIKKYVEIEYNTEGEEMEVILLEDIKGRGKKDQVIEVLAGYGNFLVKQGKAVVATDEKLKELEQNKAEELKRAADHLNLMKKLGNEISEKSVNMTIQIGKDGKLFGSVTTKAIAEEFEKQNGIKIDRKKIDLSSDINSVGIYSATINLHPKVKATFEINVIEE